MTELVIPIAPQISLPVMANLIYIFFLFFIHSIGEPVEMRILHEIKESNQEIIKLLKEKI